MVMEKILVTGGCGFVGYALTKKLIEMNYAVDVIDDLSIGDDAKDVTVLGAGFYKGDIRNINTILPQKNYKFIFHLAALSRIQPSFSQPELTYDVNTSGTLQVLEFARKNGSKVIYSGSSSKHHNPELSPYAMSKFLGEQLCRLYRKVYNVNVDIARFYNVYGEGELVGKMAAVIGIFRKQIQQQLPITIHGDGEQRRDFTHIDDIIDGLIKVANHHTTHEDAWELGTGFNYSINQVFDMFNERYRNTLQKTYLPDVKGNYRETIRINNDALNILNWKPTDKLLKYIQCLP